MSCDFKSTLVVVPARGGSKRIKNKNIKTIFGQPMIYWPLMEISKLFSANNVLVSTDSDLIKKTVEAKGLRVPFKRPANLSGDFVAMPKVVTHALRWFEKNVQIVDYVLTIYPTAILISEQDIISAMNLIVQDKKIDQVLSATTFPHPIQRAFFKNSEGYAQLFDQKNFSKRSQDLVEAFHDAGNFSLSRAEAARKDVSLVNSNVKTQLLNRKKVVDLDTLEDFELAEEKLRLYKSKISIENWKFK